MLSADYIHELFRAFTVFDYSVLSLNLFLFIFARPVIAFTRGRSDSPAADSRVLTLRAVNVILFLLYLSALFLSDFTKFLSKTGLTLLLAVMATNLLSGIILKQYGRVREIDGEEYRVETYQSEIFSLLVVILATVSALLVIINIWDMTDWLKTTSVLGGLLIVVYSTKDVWAPENINGLILLYNGDVEPGALIKVSDLDILAIVLQTTLTQTRMRDLVSRHIIVVPNSRLRGCKIEILSKATSKGLYQYVEFNIGYDVAAETIDSLFDAIWQKASDEEKAIHSDRPGVAKLAETGDHAVRWKLCYWVKNAYGIVDAHHAINRAAFEVSRAQGIELNTPLTHSLLTDESKALPSPAGDKSNVTA